MCASVCGNHVPSRLISWVQFVGMRTLSCFLFISCVTVLSLSVRVITCVLLRVH